MPLNKVSITGTFDDGSGTALSGTAVFTPSQTVYFNGQPVVSASNPVSAAITGGALQAVSLVATDNPGATFTSQTGFWYWTVAITLNGVTQPGFSFFLPAVPSTKDLFALANTIAGTGRIAPSVVFLTDGATIAVDASLGNDFRVTLGGNRTISNPVNPADGQMIVFELTQDATGGRTVTWGSAFAFGASGQPSLSTAASKTDQVGFKYNAAKVSWLYSGSTLGF